MPVYTYKAIDKAASEVKGTIMAETPRQARDELRSKGLDIRLLEVVQPQASGVRSGGGWQINLFSGRTRWQVIEFTRETSTLLGVGVPLLEAIDTVIASRKPGPFRTCLMSMRENVAAGVSFAEAMKKHPAFFDEMCISTIEVGERAGTLESCLEQIASFKEQSQQVKGKVATALMYPCIVLVMGVAVSILLMTFVVPSLLEPLLQSGKELPTSTRVVKAMSDFLLGWWWALLLGVGGVVATFRAVVRTSRGQLAWHRLLLRIPILGEMIRKHSIVQAATAISVLIRTGVPFDRSLRIAAKTMKNRILKEALTRCEEAVMAGQDIGGALEKTGAFTPTVVQVFRMGQESGRMSEMLTRLATDYDRQVTVAGQRFVAILEPILIVVLAVLVGFVAFATVMPILEAGDVL